ncbi:MULTISPECIES: peptide ABC transporter substrate-binding protein [Candidatus Rhabdochlamydia]|nr:MULTISPECIES: peptide ABC transporter substrate-binding protein [Rhabdochlamydia]
MSVLRLNMKTEPKTMDPRKGVDRYSMQMHFLFFEGLVKAYPDQSMKLAQAKSYEVSEDKLTYTFHLRDTVWSNNTPVTAYDFEQTWKDILRSDFPSMSASLFSSIKNADAAKQGLVSLDEVGIKAIDAKTLVITLGIPNPYLFKLLSFSAFFPVNIENDRKNPHWPEKVGPNFLCNGPYLLEKWIPSNQVVAKRNPQYRKTEDLHPEKIIFNIVENDAITLEMFEKGLVDVIGDCLTSIPLEALPDLEKKWSISRAPKPSSLFINLNTDKVPFNNSKIRRALGLAINRRELIEISGMDQNQANLSATSMIPPCLKENRCCSFFKDHDIIQARVLLEEGLKELGLTKEVFASVVLYYYAYSSGTNKLMQIIQQQWLKALDLFIKIECLEFGVAIDKLIRRDYSMGFACWIAMFDDPMNSLGKFKSKMHATNFCNWESPEYTQLLNQSFYEEGEARLDILEQAEKVFLSEMPYIPLYHEDYVYIINPRLPFTIPLWCNDRMLIPSKGTK